MYQSITEVPNLAGLADLADVRLAAVELDYFEFLRLMAMENAFWRYPHEQIHQFDKRPPHACLTSGKHSDFYLDLGTQLKTYPKLAELLAHRMVNGCLTSPQYAELTTRANSIATVGAADSSTELAAQVAIILGCKHVALAKNKTLEKTFQVWPDTPPFDFADMTFLPVEELLSTTSSAAEVWDAFERTYCYEARCFERGMAAVDRSPDRGDAPLMVRGFELVPAYRIPSTMWPATDCPLCADGSEAIEDVKHHWAELAGTFRLRNFPGE